MTIQLAVLGAGRIGQVHAQTIARHADAKLVTVAEPVAETARAFAAQYKWAMQTPEETAENPEIDAVIICTPTATHPDLIE